MCTEKCQIRKTIWDLDLKNYGAFRHLCKFVKYCVHTATILPLVIDNILFYTAIIHLSSTVNLS